jgi:hypothetical protein
MWLSFDAYWCHWSRLLLLHDGEGDVEGSQRLAKEALRQLDGGRRRRRLLRLRVEEEERLLDWGHVGCVRAGQRRKRMRGVEHFEWASGRA